MKHLLLLLLLITTTELKSPSPWHTFDKKSTAFYNLTQQRYFVDKTDFLEEFFSSSAERKQLFVITCPHQFGKTMVVEMMKSFAGIEIDKRHAPVYSQDTGKSTQAYEIFRKLSIGKNKKIMHRHLANHPVMLFDLKLNLVHGKRWCSFIPSLLSCIRKMFLEYSYILDIYGMKQGSLSVNSNYNYRYMVDAVNSKLDRKQAIDCLKLLIDVVSAFHNRSVILMIDHYDNLVSEFSGDPLAINKAYGMINRMISGALKKLDDGLYSALIFGVSSLMLEVRKPVKWSRKITYFPFLAKHRFTKYFGFTKSELASLCMKYDVTPDEAIQMKVLFEYQALNFTRLYDPFSVIEYLEGNRSAHSQMSIKTVENKYSGRKDEFNFISTFMKIKWFREIAIMLLRRHRMYLPIVHVYHQSKNVFESISNPTNFDFTMLLTHFYEHGFLSRDQIDCSYSIPNLEVYVELKNKLKIFYLQSNISWIRIEQLIVVLKEILLCTDVEIKQNLNQTMNKLIDDLKQMSTEKLVFDDYSDLRGLIYAFAPERNLWICSEDMAKNMASMKSEDLVVLQENDLQTKLKDIIR